jgi:hypothetical protein
MPVHVPDCVRRPASGAVAVRIVLEVDLEDGFQYEFGGGLNRTITDGRNAERTLASPFVGITGSGRYVFETNSSRKPASQASRPRSSICSKLTPSTPGAPALARAMRMHMSARPSKKSVQQLKAKVQKLLVPSNTDPWPEARDDLNRTLRGWSSYFNLGSPVGAFRSVDHYVRERVRGFLARRHKVAGRGNRRFTFDEIHRNREVLCLERLPRPAPLWASR